MKKNILFILLYLLPFLGFSQPTEPLAWSKVYGGTLSDKANSIFRTTDGGYIVAGSSQSADGNLSLNFGNSDYWVVKTDILGNIQWQNVYGGSGDDVATSIIQTNDGSYIVAGYSNSTDVNVTQFNGGLDFWIVKLTTAGTIQWQKNYGGSGDDIPYEIIQCYDNGYMIVGSSSSTDGNITTHKGLNDAWVLKIDALGAITSQESFGGTLNDEARSVLQQTDNTYTVACNTESNDGNVTLNKGMEDVWIIKLSASGTLLSQKTFGGSLTDKVSKIIPTKDGGFFAVGSTNSPDGDVTGNHSSMDFWALKMTPTFLLLWQKCLGGTGIDEATSVVEAADSSLVISGTTQSFDGDVSLNHGMSDYWAVMLHKSGNMIWQRALGGSAYDKGQAITRSLDNNFVIAGSSQSSDGNVFFNHGAEDYWLAKVKCLTADFMTSSDSVCPNQNVSFTNTSSNATQFTWKMNNVIFGNQVNSAFTFTTPGNFKVTLLATNSTCADSISKIIHVYPLPLVKLGNDTTICAGTSLALHTGLDNTFDIYWSTGANTPSIIVNNPGIYWVNVFNPATGCMKADTIQVFTYPNFGISLGSDQTICAGNSVILNPGYYSAASYSWSTNATTQSIPVTTSGVYSVTVTNSNGCKAADTAVVTVNPKPNINLGPDKTPCAGTSVVLDAGSYSGGSYQWSSGQTSQTLTVTANGDYSVTVTNSFSCSDRDTINVSFKPNPTVNLGKDTALCNVSLFTLNAGYQSGYTYYWSTAQNSQIINVASTGNYSVTVTNSFGCTDRDTINVALNPAPVVNLGPDQIKCAGDIVTFDAGYITGASYHWSTGQSSQTIQVSTTGAYHVTVTNTFGCTGKDTVNITFNPNPTVNLGPDKIICAGNSVTLDAGYQTGLSYNWSSGQNLQTINVTAGGNYSVTVTNSLGCTDRDTLNVTVNPLPIVNLGPDQSACNGATITLDAGYFPGASYLWSTGAATQAINTISGGLFFVEVTNASGCKGKDTANVVYFINPLIITDSIKNISCSGLNDGAVYTTISGGTANFTYQWAGSSLTMGDISNLGAGNYALTVTDANGCKDTSSFILIEPALLKVDSVNVMYASCSYSTDGAITVNISGGTQPYFYSIDNGLSYTSIPEFLSLASGVYSVLVKDAHNCSASFSGIPVTVLNNFTVSLGSDTIICSGSSITLNAGNPGAVYNWSTSETSQTIAVSTGSTYFVTVTSNGCSATDNLVVAVNPTIIATTDSIWKVSCFGLSNGAVFTSITGGTSPYQLTWTNTSQTTEDINNLTGGTYELLVTDTLGCSGFVTANVTEPLALTLNHTTINISCFGSVDGAINLIPNGGTSPYSFQWSSGISNPINLAPGIYSVTVTDSNVCTANLTDTVFSPDELIINIDSITDALVCGSATGAIYTSVTGGTMPYNYQWSGSAATTGNVTGIIPGSYTVTVTDNNGCSAKATATVYDIYCQTFVVPANTLTSICDMATYYDLSPISIIENGHTSSGFIAGQNNAKLILNAPSGFVFNPDSGNVYFGNGLNDITSASLVVTQNNITVTVSTGAGYLKADTLEIYGIEVKALNPPAVVTENILSDAASTLLVNGTNLTTIYGTIHQSKVMTISQVETFQTDSNLVVTGSLANEILGIRIRTSGSCGMPMEVEEFGLNTNGSDNAPFNIPEAKIFYTGNSPNFAAINIQGTALNPDGGFSITAATPQTLLEGDNYFWLAYDIQNNANILDFVDGQCVKVVIDSSYYYPVSTGPDYRRQISTLSDFVSHGSGNWNSGPTWGGSKTVWAPDADNNVTIINGDVITLTSNASCANLTITDGLLILGSYQLTVSGNLTGNEKDSIRSTSSSILVINDLGSKDQFPIPKAMKKLKKLTLNRAAGASCDHDLDLDDNVPSDSIVLVLNNGALVMSSGKKFYMNSKAIQKNILCSNSAYVDGIVSRNVKKNSGFYTYPLGNNGESRQFGIATQSGNSNNISEVQFFYTLPVNYSYVNITSLPGGITDKYYWHHVFVSGGNTQRRIYYKDSDFPTLDAAARDSALMLANNIVSSPTTEWNKAIAPYTVYDNTGQKFVQFDDAGVLPLAESNIVTNGDFSAGNSGFTSGYTYVADNPAVNNELWPEGYYSVGANARNFHPNFSALTKGHGGSGNYMIVNGNTVNNIVVWQQTITVLPNTTYDFSAWLCSVHPLNPANLQFSVNGATIGTNFTATVDTLNHWEQFYTTWLSGGSTSATISIVNKNIIANGNDFGLDDISFSPCVGNDEYWTFGSIYTSMPLVVTSLPIELYSFDATLEEAVVNLDWVTKSETNNDFFTIEKAGPDMIFTPLFTIDGAGNSYSTLLYHAEDDAPLKGVSYYRLKQTDFNGDYSYSDLRVVVNNENTPVMIYPNPVTSDLFIQIYNPEVETIYLSLIDEKGSVVYDNEYSFTKGNNQIHLNIQNLRKSPYILRIDTKDNTLVPIRKVILKM
jgi:hypothetical protein